MHRALFGCSLSLVLLASTRGLRAEDLELFNGRNLDGWTFAVPDSEDHPLPQDQAWVVRNGLLIATGGCDSYLTYDAEFEDYVLTVEWRSMSTEEGRGLAISGSGALFLHKSDEPGTFHRPKSIEVGLFNDPGSVYFRDVDPFGDTEWAFRASDAADEAEHEMGEWNRTQVFCRGDQVTVTLNGVAVNQVEELQRTRGAIALQSQRGSFPAPSFYRTIRVQPLPESVTPEERAAARQIAAAREASEKAEMERVARREAEERKEKMRREKLNALWADIDVTQDLEFSASALDLPLPADARDIELDVTFGDIELMSDQSLAELSKFYRTEMARRGWDEGDREREEDSVDVTFRHGDATVELELEDESDGVAIVLDCRNLSFDGANDPARLVALGIPQPDAYLTLQRTFELPDGIRDLEYTGGDRCQFKCSLELQDLFDQLTQQLRKQGYRESRRPIITETRRYTEFRKGRIELGVNIFSHPIGSRASLTCEQD